MASGATDYRRCFFHAAQDDIGAALLSKVLEIFDGWRQTGVLIFGERFHVLSPEQTRLAEQGYDILNVWFARRGSYPASPQTFAVEAGWPALWEALHHRSYWLSVAEVQCVAACCSCRVHAHIDHGIGSSVAFTSLQGSESVHPFRCDALVVLKVPGTRKR